MKKLLFLVLFSFVFIATFPTVMFARIGVGVTTGKIQVDERLKPGTIYELPPLTVLNTGDESSNYAVSIAYHEGQEQLTPPKEWFSFTPADFHLEPGEAQTVNIRLSLPVKTIPGDYFAYLEGYPERRSTSGSASIGVAAAAKLYFTVAPASFFEGVYYKLLSFFKIYRPWPQRAVALFAGLAVLKIFKKYFNVEINLKKGRKGFK